MTLMSGEKYSESKWKNGYGGNGSSTKRLPILSLTSSIFLLLAIILIVVLKFLVVLSKFRFIFCVQCSCILRIIITKGYGLLSYFWNINLKNFGIYFLMLWWKCSKNKFHWLSSKFRIRNDQIIFLVIEELVMFLFFCWYIDKFNYFLNKTCCVHMNSIFS